MTHITRIGGIFFKSQASNKLKVWCRKHLEIPTDDYGAIFKVRDHARRPLSLPRLK